MNGYGGVQFARCDGAGVRDIQEALARRGTTHFLATITTSPLEMYATALDVLAAATAPGADGAGMLARILGVHLEGPFLAASRRGAHPERYLRDPDVALVDDWLARAPIRMMTLAPERPSALALIDHLVRRGVTVSIGHTDADAALAHAAVDAGATAHTHVWNAHRPVRSRDPGSGGVALSRAGVVPCFIADLVHIAPEVLGLSVAASAERYVVVSDVSSAAGRPDGRVVDDGVTFDIAGGAVRLADGTLAGSASLLDQSLRNLLEMGRPVTEAVAALTSRPARLIGIPDVGELSVGGLADVVVLDDRFEVVQVLIAGRSVAI